MEGKFYKQCWFWLMMIFILLLVAFITFECSCWPCFIRTFCSVDILSALASLATIGALIATICIFCVEKKRERKRATIEAFPMIRKEYYELGHRLSALSRGKRNYLLKKYMTDMEHFAAALNDGEFDIDIVNKMSGGMLLAQYDDYVKDFIQKQRNKKDSTYIRSKDRYCEYEKMINKIYKLRSIKSN